MTIVILLLFFNRLLSLPLLCSLIYLLDLAIRDRLIISPIRLLIDNRILTIHLNGLLLIPISIAVDDQVQLLLHLQLGHLPVDLSS